MMKLYPYQEEGVDAIEAILDKGLAGALLADEPGLGKTIQVIEYLNRVKPMHTLVVCPSSVKINWLNEIRAWTSNAPVAVNTLRGRKAKPVTPGFPQITIVNYDLLPYLDWKRTQYDVVVFDEAHMLKSPKAKRTKAALKIPARQRILLTGTPILNRPREIWPLLVLCGAVNPKRFHEFGLQYCGAFQEWIYIPGGNGNRRRVWNYDGHSNIEALHQKLTGSIMIRRLKSKVLPDLPPKTRRIVELPRRGRPDISWDKYQAAVKLLEDGDPIAFEEISLVRHETALEKLPKAIEYIRDALEESGKIIVFAHHRDLIDELSDAFPRSVRIVGGMTAEAKQKSVDTFQGDPECQLFIGNIAAAGVGITLTAASRVIFVELPWTPAELSQAEDRAHRIGQKDNVLVEHLVFERSIDARIAKVLVQKQGLVDRAIDGTRIN